MSKKNTFRQRNRVLTLWTIIPLGMYILFFVVPVIMGINYSLTDWNGLTQSFNYVGFDNFFTLFGDRRIMNSLSFTGLYTFLLVIIVMSAAMVLTLLLTYVVNKKMRTIFRSIIFFPAILSMVTVGLTWSQIMFRILPWVGQTFNIGWLSQNMLGHPDTAIWGILTVHAWQGTAIPFVILLAGIQNVPTDLYEAARIDGAKAFQIFRKITIPFLMPAINVAFVMVLRSGLMVFDYIQTMTGGGPMRVTESAAVLMYQMSFQDGRAGLSSAYAVVVLVILVVVSFLQSKISSKIEVGQL